MGRPYAADMEFSEVTTDAQTWRYADEGTADAVILLHGFPDLPHGWSDIAAALADAGHRAVVPYLRGYHPATLVDGRSFDHETIGADVLGLMDALDIDEAVLVGHDWGASVIWSVVDQAPERLRGVVPIAIPHLGALKPSPQALWLVRHFFYFKAPGSDSRAARNDFAYVRGLFARWAPDWHGPARVQAEAEIVDAFGDPAVLHAALDYYRALSLGGTGGGRCPVPGLMVAGSADFGGDLAAYERSADFFDAPMELLVVEGAGHWPHREDEPAFVARLLAFLGSL